MEAKSIVGHGWHPWYEVKADPESPENLIVCGSKWDAGLNALLGFVYASSDAGRTWRPVLEDRNSTWVAEHSCAYGLNHRAYFISEASRVIDGKAYHHLGTTRLYVSTDSGQHWIETIKTGWADFSTSSVSRPSGRLYTFYNAITNLGLLVFSPDGKKVAGPFFNFATQDHGYRGIYPSSAITLNSGTVVALYSGVAPGGMEADLGVIRADKSEKPSLESTVISHTVLDKDCPSYDRGSLAYDSRHNRLFVLYGDGCKKRQLRLTSSDDEGRTWAKSSAVTDPSHSGREVVVPSIAVGSDGTLGLLWEEGLPLSGRWFLSTIHDQKTLDPPMELSSGAEKLEFSNDSLSWFAEHDDQDWDTETRTEQFQPSITMKVRIELNGIWKVGGVTAVGDKMLAIWPFGGKDGTRLYSTIVGRMSSVSKAQNLAGHEGVIDPDVTQQTAILYGGTQHFDRATATLKVCMILGNRGDVALTIPIKLEAKDVRSSFGTISILNAANGLPGAGAIWDISKSVTGNQIPSGADSNPFCLDFHLEILPESALPAGLVDLVILKLRVLASTESSPRTPLVH